MTEMVERVARAIEAALSDAYWERERPSDEDHHKAARAAIEAMREPTQAMLDVGLPKPYWANIINAALAGR